MPAAIDGRGAELFREVCRQDLEGIVAKRRNGVYDADAPTGVKIKNRQYSQAVGWLEDPGGRIIFRLHPAAHGVTL